MFTFVVAESTVTNSLGRAFSRALIAEELGPVELWAHDDGPIWVGARHFDLDIKRFGGRNLSGLVRAVRTVAEQQPVLVWISKGLSPLDQVAWQVKDIPNVQVVADFDDDDVSLMREQVRKSIKTALHLNVFHRKSPRQDLLAQRRTASAACAYTFSSEVLRETFSAAGLPERPAAVVSHARPTSWLVPERTGRQPGALRLSYLGTVRPHKGGDRVLRLVETMEDIEFWSFSGAFQPPNAKAVWHGVPPEARLKDVYANIDFTLVPQDPTSPAARNQLPAKIVEAAAFGVAVAATPTPVIEEYCAGSYLPVPDWSDSERVAALMRSADPVA